MMKSVETKSHILVPNVLHALTAFCEFPEKQKEIDPTNQSVFRFDQVRSTVLSYLIYADSLTVAQTECPTEMIDRVEWLEKAFADVFKKKLVLLEKTEESVAPPKRTA